TLVAQGVPMKYTSIAFAIALGSAAVATVPAFAEDFPPGGQPFQVLSEGTATCGEFVTAPRETQALMTDWVLGFLSGLNAGSSGKLRLVGHSYQTFEPVLVWLINYCTSHAFDYLPRAAFALRKEYISREGLK